MKNSKNIFVDIKSKSAVVTSEVEYFDQFDDCFKDQINISWIIFDDQEKK